MELINYFYCVTIENIPLIKIKKEIDNDNYIQTGFSLMLKDLNNKLIPIKCVKDYYLDPKTNKKIKINNVTNPCHNIQKCFNIENVDSRRCVECHRQAINNYLKGQISLYKK